MNKVCKYTKRYIVYNMQNSGFKVFCEIIQVKNYIFREIRDKALRSILLRPFLANQVQ